MSSRFSWLGSGSKRRQENSSKSKYSSSSYRKLRCRKSTSTANSQVYISNCDQQSCDSDDENEILELTKLLPSVHGSGKPEPETQKPKPKSNWHSMYDFLEHHVQHGDTLQIISMRYGCKVSDLKRANNIISDREFYGLVRVKVPVKAYGVHFEDPALAPARTNCGNADVRVVAVSIAGHISGTSSQDGKGFLEKMDADLSRIRQSLKTQKDSLEEVVQALDQKRIHPMEPRGEPTPKGYNWNAWIVFLIIVLLIIPIFLLVLRAYYK